ncbi:MAG: hypothetical protein AAGE89_03990 [Pseudomonadota bacterium]
MLNRLLLKALSIIFVLLCLTVGAQVNAADFKHTRDHKTGCILELKGKIETGDAQKLERLIAGPKYFDEKTSEAERAELLDSGFARIWLKDVGINFEIPIGRLCLNSPGGSFEEGLKIARLIENRAGTVIRQDEECLSACAIIFMAGSHYVGEDGGAKTVDRHMHKTAHLGFHAPALGTDLEAWDRILMETAYAQALKNAEEILASLDKLSMDQFLFRNMLRTPPKEFFYIDTPGKAGRWDIAVYGVDLPKTIDHRHVFHACEKALVKYRIELGDEISSRFYYNLDETGDEVENYGISVTDHYHERDNRALRRTTHGFEASRGGYLGEDATDCVLSADLRKYRKNGFSQEIGTVKLNRGPNPPAYFIHPVDFYDPSKPILGPASVPGIEINGEFLKW